MNELIFYTYPSCTSCRKTKKWLTQNGVSYKERHIFRETPTAEEIREILSLTTEGLDEILATRSQTFKSLNLDVDSMPLSEVIDLLVKEPKLLRRPILCDGKKLVVGYNPESLPSLTNKKNSLAI